MGDHEYRAPLHQLIHALLHDLLGAGVDRRGGLVQDHHGRIRHGGSRDGEELPLPLGEVCAVAVEHRVIAVRQARDEVVRAGEARGLTAFLVSCLQTPVADVLHDGARKQVRLLKHDAQRAAQVGLFDLIDVDAVIANLAVRDVVEAVDEVRDGGLARAGGADEGHLLPGFRVEGHVRQYGLARLVFKVHVLKPHVARQRGQAEGAVRIRALPRPGSGTRFAFQEGSVGRGLRIDQRHRPLIGLRRFVHHLEHAARTRQAHDHGVDLIGQLPHVARQLLGHVEEGNHNADADGQPRKAEVGRVRDQEQPARHRHQHVQHVADVAEDGHEHVCVAVGLARVLKERFIDLVKLLLALRLVAEDLDDLLAVHHLFDEALGFAKRLLLAHKVLGRAASDLAGDRHHAKKPQKHQRRQPAAEVQHHRVHRGDDHR